MRGIEGAPPGHGDPVPFHERETLPASPGAGRPEPVEPGDAESRTRTARVAGGRPPRPPAPPGAAGGGGGEGAGDGNDDHTGFPPPPPTAEEQADAGHPAWANYPLAWRERLGRYVVLARLGAGGMGAVVQAWHTGLGQIVALKVIRPRRRRPDQTEGEFQDELSHFRTTFLREVFISSKLVHPGIVRVLDGGEMSREKGGTLLYYASEYVPGRTLHDYLKEQGTLEPGHALGLTTRLAEALHYAHTLVYQDDRGEPRQGVVHRDVKPENILLPATEDGRVALGRPRLFDFGIAGAADRAQHGATAEHGGPGAPGRRPVHGASHGIVGTRFSRDGSGTRPYAPPEQQEPGWDVLDGRADVFALGVTLWECLAGGLSPDRHPFPYPAMSYAWGAAIGKKPPAEALWPEGVKPEHAVFAMRALRLRPGERYGSARTMADAIEHHRTTGALPADELLPRGLVRRHNALAWGRRRKRLLGTFAAVLLLALAAGGWWWRRPGLLEVHTEPPGVLLAILDPETGERLAEASRPASPGEPARFQAPAGLYRLVAFDPRFEAALPGVGLVQLQRLPGNPIHVAPAVRTGLLTLASRSPGARVQGRHLDGLAADFDASTPFVDRPVAAGRWELECSAEAHVPIRRTVDVPAGGALHAGFSLSGRVLWDYEMGGGAHGPVLADLDADGVLEVLVSSDGGTLACLTASGRVRWVYRAQASMKLPVVADLAGDGRLRVLAGSLDGALACLSATGDVLWTARTPAGQGSFLAADIDGDGAAEVLVPAANGTLTCLTGSGKVRWTHPARVEQRLPVVADLDGDGGAEILTAVDERTLVCLDARGEVRWTWQGDVRLHGDNVRVHDLDPPSPDGLRRAGGDGTAEVLVRALDGTLTCLSAAGHFRWRYQGDERDGISQVLAVDLDGDGMAEVLAPGGDGTLACLSAAGEVLWKKHYRGPVSRPAVADLDGDGRLEVLAGYQQGTLACLTAAGQERWVWHAPGGNARASVADLDGDGRSEVLAASAEALTCLSADGEVLWSMGMLRLGDLTTADLDGDGGLEVLIWEAHRLLCLAGLRSVRTWSASWIANWRETTYAAGPWVVRAGDRTWEATHRATGAHEILPFGAPFAPAWDPERGRLYIPRADDIAWWSPGGGSARLASIDAPGGLALAGGRLLAGTRDGRLVTLDPEDGTLLWILELGGPGGPPALGLDLDGNGIADHALAVSRTGRALLVDLVSGSVAGRLDLPAPVRHAPLLVASGRGTATVLVACQDGTLLVLGASAADLAETARFALESALASAPTVADTDGDGISDLVLAASLGGWLVALSPSLDRVLWARREDDASTTGSLVACDLDGDGAQELAVSWYRRGTQEQQQSAEVVVYDGTGAILACLGAGREAFRLAPGGPPLAGYGDADRAWGPWPRFALRGRTPPPDPRLAADYPRRADEYARRIAAVRPARLVPLKVDPLEAAPPAPVVEEPQADFYTRPQAQARGLDLAVGGGGLSQYKDVGLVLDGGRGGRLAARFTLDAPRAGVRLLLEHEALSMDGPGYAPIAVVLDGRIVVDAWDPPVRYSEEESFPLGALAAGEHRVEVRALPRSATTYGVRRLGIEWE